MFEFEMKIIKEIRKEKKKVKEFRWGRLVGISYLGPLRSSAHARPTPSLILLGPVGRKTGQSNQLWLCPCSPPKGAHAVIQCTVHALWLARRCVGPLVYGLLVAHPHLTPLTVWVSMSALRAYAVESLNSAAETCRVGYITNNASRTDATVAAHLRELGLRVEPSDVGQAEGVKVNATDAEGGPPEEAAGDGAVAAADCGEGSKQ